MPRPLRICPVGVPFHVVNRGQAREQIFLEDFDYEAFVAMLCASRGRYGVKVYAWCVMPNHFHAAIAAEQEGAVSAALHWVQTRISLNFREITQTIGMGHVFQRRFWSRPLQWDLNYLIALRYIEGNAQRGGLVRLAEDWPWGSLWARVNGGEFQPDESPVPLSSDWVHAVNLGVTTGERKALLATRRGRPPTARTR